ncbi:hypothetical protein [Virgibacillus doumboii]|uniref:hypothetical protein n=1 Tax=Virgibacillus doumboii TaxID=2697503 RepID=UPI0013DF4EDD|nr:hypothetical protein [Virgibacillus doumboii]
MKKSLIIMLMIILSVLPATTVLATADVNLTGEIEMEGEHSTFSDGEVSEEEWNNGLPGGSDGAQDPGAEDPSITDQLGNLIGGLWDDAKEIAKNVVGVTWDAITDLAGKGLDVVLSIGDSIGNAINSVTEWFNNLPDVWQDALLTIGAIVIAIVVVLGVIALGALLIAGSVFAIPAAVVIGVIAGAALVGAAYFALNGGTDDFSFSHALMWAMGGGAVGAFFGTSAGGAVVSALARKFAPKFAAEFMLILRLGGRGMAARFLAGAWLKSAAIPMAGLVGFTGINAAITGELPTAREFGQDAVLTLLTAPIGGPLASKAIGLFKNGRVFSGIAHAFAGMNVGGITSFLMGAAGSGHGTWSDYLSGLVTSGLFIGLAPFAKRFLQNNRTREYVYELFKKFTGGKVSDLFKGKKATSNISHSTVNTPTNLGTVSNIYQKQPVSVNSTANSISSQNKLTRQEEEAVIEYLNNMQAK